jgi:protocatechuate 3,4-dioxygenase beta subunit
VPQGAAPQRGQQAVPQNAQQQQQQQGITFTATTDDLGKFVLRDVDEGSYRLFVARNGFVRGEYGQRSVNRPGTVITVRAGQQITDVAFRLIPASTISGRVMDSTGEPLAAVTVQALRSTYDATGKRTLQPVGTAKTNDLGEYRIYWINPGRYFISANPARSAIDVITASASQAAALSQDAAQAQAAATAASLFGPSANPNEVADPSFGLTYYPGSADATRAVGIDLQPGAEIRSIDFNLTRSQRVRVSGRIIDSTTGQPPQGAQVSITPRDSTSASPFDALIGLDPAQGNRYNPVNGEFVLPSVATGSYWLQVIAQGAAPTPGATPTPQEAMAILNSMNTARMSVDVLGNNIDNIVLTVGPGISIPGRVRFEGRESTAADLQRIGISLQSTSGGASILTLLQGGAIRPAEDGTFSVPRITAGDYKLSVTGLGPTLYVKEARLGQNDAFGVVSITEPFNGSFDIVLRPNPGQVTGIVSDATQKPVSGVQAVLIPDRNRDRQDLYRTANSDLEGRFTFRGIAPGDYRIFAWEDIEPFSYFDSAVLSQYEAAGKPVRIQESSSETVDVKLIPAKTN